MIILYTIGLSILLLFFASCSLVPAYIFFNNLLDNSIRRPTKNRHRCLTYRSRISIVNNIGLFFSINFFIVSIWRSLLYRWFGIIFSLES